MVEEVDIIVYGSLNMDFVAYVRHLPRAGETIAASSFAMVPGGKAANQAVAASRLGSAVAMVGRVGEDELGDKMRIHLESDGVDCRFLRRTPGVETGVASIAVDPDGQNTIITFLGANACVSASDIDATLPLLRRARYVMLQMEMDPDAGEHIIRLAKKSGASVVLNLAPVVPIREDLYSLVDLLIVNETEASQLTGVSVTSPETALRAASKLRDKGAKNVVVTLGREGAVLQADGASEGTHYTPPLVQAVDATAAGDCFVAAATHFWNDTGDLQASVRRAVDVAALSVTRKGAQPSLPTLEEFLQFMLGKEGCP
ncbi:ribokinase [uncultured Paenibacillus sp.]|uniref:ribokinase n=1 Tax=uncultured Paenibacillus sp. TaxID=227322 RepID=UPI0028D54F74|nr:ribokinase [uncultured Paenibacillus sp.]